MVDRSTETSSCVASPNSPAAKRLARSSSDLMVPPSPTAFIATFMTRSSPMTREIRGSLMTRKARPTTTSLTASNIDIIGLCHAPPLASTRTRARAPPVLAIGFGGTDRRVMDTANLRKRIADLRAEFEERLAALVTIPTVSMDPGRRAEMDACAALAGRYLREAGARVDVIETGGFPLLLGRIGEDPTLPTETI